MSFYNFWIAFRNRVVRQLTRLTRTIHNHHRCSRRTQTGVKTLRPAREADGLVLSPQPLRRRGFESMHTPEGGLTCHVPSINTPIIHHSLVLDWHA